VKPLRGRRSALVEATRGHVVLELRAALVEALAHEVGVDFGGQRGAPVAQPLLHLEQREPRVNMSDAAVCRSVSQVT